MREGEASRGGGGVRVLDANRKCYLDLTTGIAVTALGHSHPKCVAAVQEQSE